MHRKQHAARVAALAIIATSLPALIACGGKGGTNEAAAEAAPTTMTVGPENVAVVTTAELSSGPAVSGALQPDREATIRAEVGGSVLQTMADQGTRVSAGAPLARIDASAINDSHLSAKSAVTSAELAAQIAQRELERMEKLAAAGAIADRDLEAARRNNVAAESQLADAKARLANAWKQLESTRVKAPFNGVVSARQVSAGDVVQPGTALYTVVDPTSMRFEG
jgi:membrane fusion protein, multidrug efflux system